MSFPPACIHNISFHAVACLGASSTPSLFGGTPAPASSPSLFGGSAFGASTPGQPASLFAAASAASPTPSLFGGATPGMFGATPGNQVKAATRAFETLLIPSIPQSLYNRASHAGPPIHSTPAPGAAVAGSEAAVRELQTENASDVCCHEQRPLRRRIAQGRPMGHSRTTS
eukprot:scaffold187287_cov28-Prasinocladus_malaysianus.AAC.1